MQEEAMRAWTGRFQWPNKDEFRFGTIFVRKSGTFQEVHDELIRAFDAAWSRILPDAVERPKLIDMEPGTIWFQPEE